MSHAKPGNPDSHPSYPIRVWVGIAVLLSMSAESSFRMVAGFVQARKRKGLDAITLQEGRFDQLKKALPARGEVSYASDLDPNSVAGIAARELAQYFLAPVQLAGGQDLIVYSSFSRTASRGIAGSHFKIVRDFGNGLMLFQRQEK
jgi:hypothetical protein